MGKIGDSVKLAKSEEKDSPLKIKIDEFGI